MTDWIEISLRVDGEGAEAVAEVLSRYVHQGIAIEHVFPGEAWEDDVLPDGPLVIRGYIPDDLNASDLKRQVEEALYWVSKLYPIPAPTFSVVSEEDWENAWKRYYQPVRVGKHTVIKPAWAEVETKPGDIVISMDPGMAFGTGTHPTTQLCLMAVEWFAKPGTCMADIGTGSGVLAISAAKHGSHHILGLEIDEVAVRVAQENVRRNDVASSVTIVHGSLDSLKTTGRHFDWAVANLTANIIKRLLPDGFQHVIWPGGKFVFSGIIEEQEEEITALLDGVGLQLMGRRQLGDWVMLITQRRTD